MATPGTHITGNDAFGSWYILNSSGYSSTSGIRAENVENYGQYYVCFTVNLTPGIFWWWYGQVEYIGFHTTNKLHAVSLGDSFWNGTSRLEYVFFPFGIDGNVFATSIKDPNQPISERPPSSLTWDVVENVSSSGTQWLPGTIYDGGGDFYLVEGAYRIVHGDPIASVYKYKDNYYDIIKGRGQEVRWFVSMTDYPSTKKVVGYGQTIRTTFPVVTYSGRVSGCENYSIWTDTINFSNVLNVHASAENQSGQEFTGASVEIEPYSESGLYPIGSEIKVTTKAIDDSGSASFIGWKINGVEQTITEPEISVVVIGGIEEMRIVAVWDKKILVTAEFRDTDQRVKRNVIIQGLGEYSVGDDITVSIVIPNNHGSIGYANPWKIVDGERVQQEEVDRIVKHGDTKLSEFFNLIDAPECPIVTNLSEDEREPEPDQEVLITRFFQTFLTRKGGNNDSREQDSDEGNGESLQESMMSFPSYNEGAFEGNIPVYDGDEIEFAKVEGVPEGVLKRRIYIEVERGKCKIVGEQDASEVSGKIGFQKFSKEIAFNELQGEAKSYKMSTKTMDLVKIGTDILISKIKPETNNDIVYEIVILDDGISSLLGYCDGASSVTGFRVPDYKLSKCGEYEIINADFQFITGLESFFAKLEAFFGWVNSLLDAMHDPPYWETYYDRNPENPVNTKSGVFAGTAIYEPIVEYKVVPHVVNVGTSDPVDNTFVVRPSASGYGEDGPPIYKTGWCVACGLPAPGWKVSQWVLKSKTYQRGFEGFSDSFQYFWVGEENANDPSEPEGHEEIPVYCYFEKHYPVISYSVESESKAADSGASITRTPKTEEDVPIESGTGEIPWDSWEWGSEFVLTASTSTDGSQFVGWVENGEIISTEQSLNVVATDDRNIVARFGTTVSASFSDEETDPDFDGRTGNYVMLDGLSVHEHDTTISKTVAYGSTVIVCAAAGSNSSQEGSPRWHFTGWTSCSFANRFAVRVETQSPNYVANFSLTPVYYYLLVGTVGDDADSGIAMVGGAEPCITGEDVEAAEEVFGGPAPEFFNFYKVSGPTEIGLRAELDDGYGITDAWTATRYENGSPVGSPVEIGEGEGTIPYSVTYSQKISGSVGSVGQTEITVGKTGDSESGSGIVGFNDTDEDPETHEATRVCYDNERVSVFALPNNGYQFFGWYTAADDGELISLNKELHYEKGQARPSSLYAKFSKSATGTKIEKEYIVDNTSWENEGRLCVWEGSQENKWAVWRSARVLSFFPLQMSSVHIHANDYSHQKIFNIDYCENPATPPTGHGTSLRLFSQDSHRLPHERPEKYVEIEVITDSTIHEMSVSTAMEGLRQ